MSTSTLPQPASTAQSAAKVGTAMTLASMTFVQLGLAVSVGLVDELGVAGVAWLRLAWAGVLLLVLVRPRPSAFTRSSLVACVALGVATGATTILFMAAVDRLPLGTASALEFLGPLGVAIARGRGTARLWALVAAVGVLLLTEPWHGAADPAGVAFALGAACGWACYILLTQKVGDELSGVQGLAISMPVAAVVATAVAGPSVINGLSPELLLAGLGMALLLPVIPFALELSALRRLTAVAFGTLMCLEPAIALVVGLLLLDQVPGWVPVSGIGLVILAGIGAERTGARRAEPVRQRRGGQSRPVLPGPFREPGLVVLDMAAGDLADAGDVRGDLAQERGEGRGLRR